MTNSRALTIALCLLAATGGRSRGTAGSPAATEGTEPTSAPSQRASLLAEAIVRSAALSVTLRTADGTLAVEDRRTGRRWEQQPLGAAVTIKSVSTRGGSITLTLAHPAIQHDVRVVLRLDGDRPEFTLTLSSEGALKAALGYPYPFVTAPGTYLVIPMNEGISYPVEDESIRPMRLIAYGGHGICMAFWGVTDGRQGQMAILETADDAAIRIARRDDKLCIAPEWDG
jgi:hypothetical protein